VVAVALGSNLGDRDSHLRYAVSRLEIFFSDLRVSSFHTTAPFDVPDPDAQPLYLNAAAIGRTSRAPREVLHELLSVERARGRERPHHHAARTLDLDLILYGDSVLHEPDLVVPHPGFRERRFVLEPLAEIAPGLVDPVTGRTVEELLAMLPR
jgi:2-amino-4-hydroxy-6-hydroxymethyldihydropteridine diphosphokinase